MAGLLGDGWRQVTVALCGRWEHEGPRPLPDRPNLRHQVRRVDQASCIACELNFRHSRLVRLTLEERLRVRLEDFPCWILSHNDTASTCDVQRRRPMKRVICVVAGLTAFAV